MSDGFTISVRDWRITREEVETSVDPNTEEYILVEYPLTDDPEERHIHAMPMSGIAFRMEILGLSEPVEVMEMMLKELNVPEDAEEPRSYPQALESYYTASTNIAKALAEEVNTVSARSSEPVMSPDEFLSDVRNLLRGQPPSFCRALSVSAVTSAVDALSSTRSTSLASLQDIQQSVVIEETEPMASLRQEILGRSETISKMADEHAYRAMETGAFYYARMIGKAVTK